MTVSQRFSCAVFPFFLVCCAQAQAESRCAETVATVVSVQGNVDVRGKDAQVWQPLKADMDLCAGDSVTVRRFSRTLLRLEQEQTNVQLGEGSTLTLPGGKEQDFSVVELLKGIAHFISRVPQALKIKTPFVNAAIEGTDFIVKVDDEQALVSVTEGHVNTDNAVGQLTLQSGQSALTTRGAAPGMHTVADPMESVQWALYYPHVFEFEPQDITSFGLEPWRAVVADSVRALRANDLSGALSLLEQAGGGITSTQYFLYRAHLLLMVGRVAEAQADIEQVLEVDAGSSQAWALRAVIAVTLNHKDQAMTFSAEAVKLAPRSAAARIAQSYADQAQFDLDAALQTMQTAVSNEPDNALAWARLAELWLMHGKLDEAQAAAQAAIQRQPGAPQARTVLGFVRLLLGNPAAARVVFADAIRLDPAAPLPRLGLGLAYIRQGHLEIGRTQLEIATSLDPRNSLLRSYVGKAYYEEKRGILAGEQFALAKELDPKDPTPWFYNAILLQTQNRPVEALYDAQKSIDLNDNRAVYRSRLLLDDDLAVRSVSQARIYKELGLDQLGLKEAYKSVNVDPSNYSGHRFLADTYTVLPRHETARVSELLQAQLLQPLSLAPLQTQRAETDLGILEGEAGASFNEYGSLFAHDGTNYRANALIGSQNTHSNELALSGLQGNFSYSLSRFYYRTDGYRPNNDLRHRIYTGFAQVALSPRTSIQAEYRVQDTQSGDLVQMFDPDSYSADVRNSMRRYTKRLGLHHQFSLGSDLIVSFTRRDESSLKSRHELVSDAGDPDIFFDQATDAHAETLTTEMQYIQRASWIHVLGGAGYANKNKGQVLTEQYVRTILEPGAVPEPPESTPTNFDAWYSNIYLYANLETSKTLSATLGATYDDYANRAFGRSGLSPKLGIVWQAFAATTVRVAWFKTMKRPFAANQTLEPTQVAGFNQFYDDLDGSQTQRYGLGLDHAFTSTVYGGIEESRRAIQAPVRNLKSGDTYMSQQRELTLRSYLSLRLSNSTALLAEYFVERFAATTGKVESLSTHWLPLTVHYAQPSGWVAQFRASALEQKITVSGAKDQDRFWIVDGALGYRLPKQWGSISLDVKNLFNQRFKFFDINQNPFSPELVPPLLQPQRILGLKVSLLL